MKNINKLLLAALVFAMIFTANNLKAQDTKDSKIGLTVGLDYISNYIYRSQYRYLGNFMNGGMLAPYVSYDVFDTGLSVGIKGEITEMWVWAEKDKEPNGTRYNCIDFNINYMYNLKEIMTFNIGSWYFRHKTIPHNKIYTFNPSFFDFYLTAAIETLPLTPMLAVTYSYFTDKDSVRGITPGGVWGDGNGKNGDLYIQFGIGHSFKLDDETYFDLDVVAGWYDKNAYEEIAANGKDPKSADISDIDLSAGLTTSFDMLSLSTSFHYIIVPGTQYKHMGESVDIHKFYAKFGVSCSI